MTAKDIDIASLPQLVEQVLTISHDLDAGRFLWFRGSGCDRLQLLPKLMRDGRSAAEVFERRLLTRFRQRSLAYWPAGYPQTDWEHLFAMQHYGLPTRLLDWSENVFVAAHFALIPRKASACSHAGPCVPVVWSVDPVGWNRRTPVLSEYGSEVYVLTTADDELDSFRPETNKKRPSTPVAMFGAHNSDRIVAQKGTFFVWGRDTTPLEALNLNGATLWKLRLIGDPERLNSDLQNLGFTETTVFPELTSLATELARVEGWRP